MLRPGGYTKKLHILIADRQTDREERRREERRGGKQRRWRETKVNLERTAGNNPGRRVEKTKGDARREEGGTRRDEMR